MLPLNPIDLEWNAPAECPSRDAVLEDAARVVAKPPEPRSHATVRADVTRDPRGQWHAALSVDADGAHSERVLDAESCQEIARAAALIVAIVVEGKEPAQAQNPHLAAPASPAPVAPARPAVSGRPQSPSAFVVSVAGVVDWGLLPSAAPGGELNLGWEHRAKAIRVRAAAGASLFGEQSADVPSQPSEGGRFKAVAASARGCASIVIDEGGASRPPSNSLDVGLCLGVEVDTVSATGFGPSSAGFEPHSRTQTWDSVLPSIIASYDTSRHVAIVVRADGVLPIRAPPFGVRDSEGNDISLHRPGAGIRIALGVETQFF
jgi:hypothetical protein